MKYSTVNSVVGLLLLILISCGNWGWESIESDNEEQLNVFGLISLDDSLESFIIVHKTLDTAGPDEETTGYDTIYYEIWEKYNEDTGLVEPDTFWYDPPYVRTIYESRYLVKNAIVTVSDGNREYSFVRSPRARQGSDYFWYEDIFTDHAIYLNTDQTFTPLPNTTYSLDVTTPEGLELTGLLTTPPVPFIKENELPDTLSILKQFEIAWEYVGDNHATITTAQVGSDWINYVCGANQSGIIEPGDTTWVSTIDSDCYDGSQGQNTEAKLGIRLRFLDENYYKYFLGTDSDIAEISNFLVGTGGIGAASGVEGGFGVFGAISADRADRIVIP